MPDSDSPARITRARVLSLLSDAENAAVSHAESTRLSEGELYLDLKQLGSGVRRALATTTVTAHALPRRAVSAETWAKILAYLADPHDPAT
jgi:hypothetical protein